MAKLSTSDWVSVSDFWGEYCWRVDEGEGDRWAELWTEDGIFVGVTPEPVVGRDQLRFVPINAYADFGQGQMRHVVANLTCEYGDTSDVVVARLYNYVSVWGGLPVAGNFCMALCKAVLVRNGDSWLIKRNDARLLTA